MTRIKNPDLSRPFPTYPGVFDLSRPSATKIDLFRPVGVGKFWSVSYVGGRAYHVVPAQVDIEINKGVSAMLNSRLNVIQCLFDTVQQVICYLTQTDIVRYCPTLSDIVRH